MKSIHPTRCSLRFSFGFEPNPVHRHRLEKLEGKLRADGMKASWFHGGVAAKDGELKFFHKLLQDEIVNEEWGFSSSFGGQSRGRPGFHDPVSNYPTVAVSVPVKNFGTFMNRVAQRRIPPATDSAGLLRPPAVVMKMDIEGAEYATLTHALVSGSLCHLRAVTLEWHDKFCEPPFCGVTHCLEATIRELTDGSHVPGCDMDFILFDDEICKSPPLLLLLLLLSRLICFARAPIRRPRSLRA
jgi:hypothetical protein